MLHDIRVPPRPCLSPGERDALNAVGEAVLPAGRRFPGADRRTVGRMEAYLAQLGPGVSTMIRGILHALDAASYARHLRPFARLDAAKRYRLLESWRTGNYVARTALRAVVTPLKLAHFDDPAFFQAIGCVYEFDRPASAERPRWLVERHVGAADLPAGEELECDVVVVGTGAGGAVVARELAERGLAVILLEEGEYHDRTTFNGRTAEMHAKLYRSMASTTTVGNTSIYVPVGRTVGGSTTINSGTCYRVPDRVMRHWRDDLGLTEITPDHMAPYFERVEAVLGVAPAKMEHVGGVGRVVARGAQKLGYRHAPIPRNAPDCDGKGVCCFGCPTDAKRSTNVSYVPMALRAGAQLITGFHVDRVTTDGGRATGVEGHATAGGGATLRIRARATVVACGTFQTPVLLHRSGFGDRGGWLGRNLSLHPATGIMAFFDEKIDSFNSIPQGYSIDEFHEEGILFEGGTTPADMTASAVPMMGSRFMELVEDIEHAAIFGFMIEDSSRGRIHLGKDRTWVSYVMNDNDVALFKRGLEILCRVFFAAGAKVILPGVHGFDEIRSEEDLSRFRRAKIHARDLMTSAYHPLGTARMGVDARSGVIGPDHQHHQVPDLYVVDGSAMPTSLAVNPQVTIMAMATRAAERLADRLA